MSTALASQSDRISTEEKQLRIDLAAAYRIFAYLGWDDLIFTHLSVRVPGPEHHFLINPYGHLFEEMTASSLVKIDLQGNIIGHSPYSVNKAGFEIHSAVHTAREDAHAVFHLHTIAGAAVASLEEGLLPLNQHSMVLNSLIAYHDYEGIAFRDEERPRIAKDLGSKNAMILRNHGTLSVGRTIAEAFTIMYFLERACAMQIAATSSGQKLAIPAPEVQQLVQRQVAAHRDNSFELLWPAMLRLMDRKCPGYRD
jgi:ribulose-5-phosphate 4-epimerase/fuculose-1-phosphate aldolase